MNKNERDVDTTTFGTMRRKTQMHAKHAAQDLWNARSRVSKRRDPILCGDTLKIQDNNGTNTRRLFSLFSISERGRQNIKYKNIEFSCQFLLLDVLLVMMSRQKIEGRARLTGCVKTVTIRLSFRDDGS